MISVLEVVDLPETADELFVADVAVAVDVIEPHEGLELNFLGENSTQMKRK